MLIYMLLNTVTEKAYVGQTVETVIHRIEGHKADARGGSHTRLHLAMRDWPFDDWWSYVVLQNCYTEKELDAAEDMWIDYCCSADPAVGYNTAKTAEGRAKARETVRKRPPMSPERREFFKQCGMKGGVHGKKGGATMHAKAVARREGKAA